LVAADGRRGGKRRRGRSRILPFPIVPPFSALALPLLLFGLPALDGFLMLEHLGVPERFPCGELLFGQRHAGGLAPDFDLHRCHSHRISGKNARGALVDRLCFGTEWCGQSGGDEDAGFSAGDEVHGGWIGRRVTRGGGRRWDRGRRRGGPA
jgi:hypothetical protein